MSSPREPMSSVKCLVSSAVRQIFSPVLLGEIPKDDNATPCEFTPNPAVEASVVVSSNEFRPN